MNKILKCNTRNVDIRQWVKALDDYGLRTEGHFRSINCIVVDENEKIAVTGSADFTVRVWDIERKMQIWKFVGHKSEVNAVDIIKDKRLIVSGSGDFSFKPDNRLIVWSLEKMRIEKEFCGHKKKVLCVRGSYDGKYVISGGVDCLVIVWNLDDEGVRMVCQGHQDSVNSIVCTSTHIISASNDCTVRLWNFKTFLCNQILYKGYKSINHLFYLPLSHNLIWTSKKKIYIWDLISSTHQTKLSHTYPISSISTNPKLSILLSLSVDNKLNIWDLATFSHQYTFFLPQGCLCFYLTNDNFLISGYSDRHLSIANFNTLQEMTNFSGHLFELSCVKISQNFSMLATGSRDCSVRVWDLKGCAELRCFVGHFKKITCVDFDKNNEYVVSGSMDATIRLWNIRENVEEYVFYIHENRVTCLIVFGDLEIFSASKQGFLIKTSYRKNSQKYICKLTRDELKSMKSTRSGKYLVCSFSHRVGIFAQFLFPHIKSSSILKLI